MATSTASTVSSSTSSTSVLGDKHDNLSTNSLTSETKPIKDTLIDPTKESCRDKEDQQHVKFGALPTIEKKEKKVKRRRTPYAWDDQLRPVFDDDKRNTDDKKGK